MDAQSNSEKRRSRTSGLFGELLASQHVLLLVIDDFEALGIELLLELRQVDVWCGRAARKGATFSQAACRGINEQMTHLSRRSAPS